MNRVGLSVLLSLCLAACASPEQTERHRETCESYGHAPGSPELASCIEKKAAQNEATATKLGTRVLTSAILGAI